MGDWIADERRRRGPSFSSALLDAISRATESSQDEVSTHPLSLPNKPKLGIDGQGHYARAEQLSFKYNSINALQVRTRPDSSSGGDRRHCCCGSSSCKWRNAGTSTSTSTAIASSNPRPAYASQGAKVMPKVKEPKLKPSKAMSPGSRLASILNSVLVSSWSKSKSQREELKGASDSASNSTSSSHSHSFFSRSMSSTSASTLSTPASTSSSSSLYKPKSKDQHLAKVSKRSSDTPPSYHTKYKSSSSSSASASATATANKEKNGKIRSWVLFEKNVVASSLRNYSTKVDNSRNLDEEDADSDSSSDLFELNSIYSRDLPVYETTHLETNKAIAKGLL
ncbi:hypothetical protein SUGI_0925180 [Cryptomeria japonica]|uniref:uncharacterized protein LOC131029761 n=1 Tax=Cryptomeria japonica TaxID=3369 RepID=UPI0024146F4F|nr:uncharacterized protein LOC131029761 [Cryptomeria japonica]GLJ44258.1 hypothetical protein SUGI_0925180 [Cryptomeria japonica]